MKNEPSVKGSVKANNENEEDIVYVIGCVGAGYDRM